MSGLLPRATGEGGHHFTFLTRDLLLAHDPWTRIGIGGGIGGGHVDASRRPGPGVQPRTPSDARAGADTGAGTGVNTGVPAEPHHPRRAVAA